MRYSIWQLLGGVSRQSTSRAQPVCRCTHLQLGWLPMSLTAKERPALFSRRSVLSWGKAVCSKWVFPPTVSLSNYSPERRLQAVVGALCAPGTATRCMMMYHLAGCDWRPFLAEHGSTVLKGANSQGKNNVENAESRCFADRGGDSRAVTSRRRRFFPTFPTADVEMCCNPQLTGG